jgi:hypothetical protein
MSPSGVFCVPTYRVFLALADTAITSRRISEYLGDDNGFARPTEITHEQLTGWYQHEVENLRAEVNQLSAQMKHVLMMLNPRPAHQPAKIITLPNGFRPGKAILKAPH